MYLASNTTQLNNEIVEDAIPCFNKLVLVIFNWPKKRINPNISIYLVDMACRVACHPAGGSILNKRFMSATSGHKYMATSVAEVSLCNYHITLSTRLNFTYGPIRAVLSMTQIRINTKTFQNSNNTRSENSTLTGLSLMTSNRQRNPKFWKIIQGKAR